MNTSLDKRAQAPEQGKRARTRKRLIEAAAAVIGEKGFDRASLEDIAALAGMTRGAVYGNFKNKEELFLALIETQWKPIVPPLRAGGELEGTDAHRGKDGRKGGEGTQEVRGHSDGVSALHAYPRADAEKTDGEEREPSIAGSKRSWSK